jgi:hypothetical protein
MNVRAPIVTGARRRARAALAAAAVSMSTFVPIPMYTTNPNEGSTFGLMPVFFAMDDSGAVDRIFAPSVSWNSAAKVNFTLRYYLFPSPYQMASLIAAASTHIDRTVWLTYISLPTEPRNITYEVVDMARRNLFFRFFGLGPDTPFSGQSSYTRTTLLATARVGYNFIDHLNLGVRGTMRSDRLERFAIFGLPLTQDAYPDAPGIEGGGQAAVAVSLRYDTRPVRDYSTDGNFAELSGSYHQGLFGFSHYWQAMLEGRYLNTENSFTQTGARVFWSQEWGGNGQVPFYYQNSLGGEVLLRGFPEDRFIDTGAWEFEVEQRFRLLTTHILDATTDWRVDPFFAIGQVYGTFGQIVDHVRPSVGIGLRAWVHPNVLGRVDIAYAGEGVRAYVDLGYPF